MRIAAASLAPLRPRFLAASIKRSTSPSVRYSLGRYAEFGNRRSVRFPVVGVSSDIADFSFALGLHALLVFVIVDAIEHSPLPVPAVRSDADRGRCSPQRLGLCAPCTRP